MRFKPNMEAVKLWLVTFFVLLLVERTNAQSIDFTYKGNNRHSIVHVPSSYNGSVAYPVVFNLHGYGSNAAQQQLYSGMNAVADTAGFIVVYPDGISNAWDIVFSNSPVDDVGYLSALLDTLISRYNVDTNRVYSCGMSMGGFMTYRLGCELSNRIAAIASVTGPTVDSLLMRCGSSRKIPVMHIHGTSDATVPYEGDQLFNHIDSTIQFFVNKNGCGAPVVTNLPDGNTSDGCTITSYHYCPFEDSTEVIFYKVTGGGHTWPGAFPIVIFGNTNGDINASSDIWNFFKRHQLKYEQSTGISYVSEDDVRVYPNPASEILNIQIDNRQKAIGKIIITDMNGKLLHRMSNPDSYHNTLNTQYLAKGLHFIHVRFTSGQSVVRKVIIQ